MLLWGWLKMPIINKLTAIAEAIRSKTETTDLLTLDEMPSAIEGIQSGGGVNSPINYMTTTAQSAFMGVTFPDGYHIEYEPKNLKAEEETTNVFNLTSMFQNVKGLEKFKLITRNKKRKTNITAMFSAITSLKVVDFSECDLVFTGVQHTFGNCTALEEIKGELTLTSDVTSYLNMFVNCKQLKEVRFTKETLRYSLNMGNSPLLSAESIQSIIDALVDFTGGTARTLTLHATVKAKLTEEQIAQITAKNWTLA